MKQVLIITHEPGRNYGGIAQAYALQYALRTMSINPVTTFSKGSPIKAALSRSKTLRYILGKNPQPDTQLISINTRKFIDREISEVEFNVARKYSSKHSYHAYITGSDQVWRNAYVYVPHYLFSFIKSHQAPILSYAASFGRDDLNEYTPTLIRRSKKLAKRFAAISVREISGVHLAKKYWDQEAQHHVDPTLLLKARDYSNLIENPSVPLPKNNTGGIFIYVLDNSSEAKAIIDKTERNLDLDSHRLISEDQNKGEPLPPIEQWLRSFRDADFVITDSFHGTVFSIIFNKPFIAIGNKERGLARFTSLLNMFGLSDRLLTSSEDITPELLSSEIDWKKVNSRVKEEQNRSMEYLRKHLSSDEQK